jgi:hypothetical protein
MTDDLVPATERSDAAPRLLVAVLTVVVAAGGATFADDGAASPYAGLETREIKALGDDAVEGYLAGHGMGFAMAAELNSYPGPKHVLELAEEFGLDADGLREVEGSFRRMQEQAVRLGREYVDAERRLDALFAGGAATEENLRAATAEVARLRGELQFVHLRAHLEMRGLLDDEQVRRYDEMRGYAGAHPGSREACPHAGQGGHGDHGQARGTDGLRR